MDIKEKKETIEISSCVFRGEGFLPLILRKELSKERISLKGSSLYFSTQHFKSRNSNSLIEEHLFQAQKMKKYLHRLADEDLIYSHS